MRPDIKICGLSTPETVAAALAGGASHVGFIFFPKSPRNVGVEQAAALRQAAKGKAQAVAVTVDADDATLDAIVSGMHPDMLQLHGKETPERVATIRSRFGVPVMKVLPIAERGDLSPIREFANVADRLLFDARPPRDATRPGGLGRTFDWTLLNGIDPKINF